jgi:molybdopterin molybdotransferase
MEAPTLQVAQAANLLSTVRIRLRTERVPIAEAAGRTLAEAVRAGVPLPPFSRAAMDGYALRAQDTEAAPTTLPVAGRTLAGDPPGALAAGQAWRIFTGAPMPEGADAVLEQEAVTESAGAIRLLRPVAAGRNVMGRGHEHSQGATLLWAGQRLTPLHLGLMAGVGVGEVAVWSRPLVAILEVGSEIADPGAGLSPGHIYSVHRGWLPAWIRDWGGEVTRFDTVPDDRARISEAVDQALQVAQVVITTGGVSVGDADFLPEVLTRVASRLFWRVAMHPGKAVAAARREDRLVLALSGNPGAALTSWLVLAAPWWAAQFGGVPRERRATLALENGFGKPTREARYLRVGRTESGMVALAQDADAISTMAETDGFALVPENSPAVAPGTPLAYWEPTGMGGRSAMWDGKSHADRNRGTS